MLILEVLRGVISIIQIGSVAIWYGMLELMLEAVYHIQTCHLIWF